MSYPCMPDKFSLAMSYVPWQSWSELYDEEKALERGTAFPALYLPFMARRSAR